MSLKERGEKKNIPVLAEQGFSLRIYFMAIPFFKKRELVFVL